MALFLLMNPAAEAAAGSDGGCRKSSRSGEAFVSA